MTFPNQHSVDDLLATVQAQADEVQATVGSAQPAGGEQAAGADGVAAGGGEGKVEGLAGEFAPPPAAATKDPRNPLGNEFQRLLAIEVPIIVRLGQRRMSVGEVIRLGVGAIIEFAKSADEDLELLANNKPIGRGHAVKVGENFGIKITAVGSVKETIRKLGGRAGA